MLVSTQTDIEKLNVVKAEKREIDSLIADLLQRPGGYLRAAKMAKAYPFTYYAQLKSKANTRYIIALTATDKRRGLTNPLLGVFALMDTETSGAEMIICDAVRNH